jgi:DNA repair photolyase
MRAARLALPLEPRLVVPHPRLRATDAEGPLRRLPHVRHLTRKGPVLHAGPVGQDGQVLSLNLAAGCVHRCGFCSARAYPHAPGDDAVALVADLPARLDEELAGRAHRPRAVYVSPATDPFPPVAEIQALTAQVVEVLARHGVEAWLMTRGFIRPAVGAVLAAHSALLKVTVAVTTLDRHLQRVLEPLAAPPRMRIRQINQLRALGVSVQAALEPLLPGLTDTRANLAAVLEALAGAGINHVTAGYLFLRPRIEENLTQALAPHGWDRAVLDAFAGGPLLHGGAFAAARYLPKARRQRGYASVMALAANLGVSVRINSVTNPDFAPPRDRPASSSPQPVLPLFEAMTAASDHASSCSAGQ